MRPGREVALALGLATLLLVGAALLGRRGEGKVDPDFRPSTFLSGPAGARGLLDALVRMRIPVQRFRKRSLQLAALPLPSRSALVILAPTVPLSGPDRAEILALLPRVDLILAGRRTEPLIRCFGYRVARRILDSSQVALPGIVPGGDAPWVRATLVPTGQRVVTDSSRAMDAERISCVIPEDQRVDTLLATEAGRPVAVRIHRGSAVAVLVADEDLFRNRALRRSGAGPWVLGLFEGRYRQVIFEEYHHGFGTAGSLGALAIGWSFGSPWGWLIWQAAAVGTLALLFGAIRFGPAEPGIPRRRRSPLEHLRALATALRAQRGHDVAIGAIVRGLRRRLAPPGLRSRGDWRGWLAQLPRSTATPRARAALAQLDDLTRPGQPSSGVLRAANAVEDLWEDLKP
jgi:hypothetical protein